MAKVNLVEFRSESKLCHGYLVVLNPDGADEEAAQSLEYATRPLKIRFMNTGDNWRVQEIVPFNKKDIEQRIIAFSNRDQAKKVSLEITRVAETIRQQKHK